MLQKNLSMLLIFSLFTFTLLAANGAGIQKVDEESFTQALKIVEKEEFSSSYYDSSELKAIIEILLQKNEPEKAMIFANKALYNNVSIGSLLDIGNFYLKNGQNKKAEETFLRAVDFVKTISPTSNEFFLCTKVIEILKKLGKSAEVKELVEKINTRVAELKTEKAKIDPLAVLAYSAAIIGEKKIALASINALIEINGDKIETLELKAVDYVVGAYRLLEMQDEAGKVLDLKIKQFEDNRAENAWVYEKAEAVKLCLKNSYNKRAVKLIRSCMLNWPEKLEGKGLSLSHSVVMALDIKEKEFAQKVLNLAIEVFNKEEKGFKYKKSSSESDFEYSYRIRDRLEQVNNILKACNEINSTVKGKAILASIEKLISIVQEFPTKHWLIPYTVELAANCQKLDNLSQARSLLKRLLTSLNAGSPSAEYFTISNQMIKAGEFKDAGRALRLMLSRNTSKDANSSEVEAALMMDFCALLKYGDKLLPEDFEELQQGFKAISDKLLTGNYKDSY